MAQEGLKKVKKGQSKKQKKSGKKKKEKETVKDEVTEVEREIYTLQIADLTRKYERLKARCLELEAEKEELQKSYEQLDEDRADVITYVKRELQKKIDEIAELHERLDGLSKSKDEEGAMFREKILQLEHDYKVMHEQLTSEIKLLSGKLNSLEEFRLQRDELMKKYKEQEQRMVGQEESYKGAMYELERKFIIGKDKLKKEMEYRLLELSQDFQDTTQLRIAATTHRTIRENIALNNELNLMLTASNRLRELNETMKGNDEKLRLGLELHVGEKKMVIAKNRVQKKIIDTLTTEHEQMEEAVAELQHKANHGKMLDGKLKALQLELNNSQLQISELEQRLDASNYEQTILRLGTVKSEKETKRLQRILRHTIRAVTSVLEVQRSPNQDEAFNTGRRESLLGNLLGLLNMADLPPEETVESTTHTQEIYETGDLGLISKKSSITSVGSGHYSKTSLKKSPTPSMRSALSRATSEKSTESTASKTSGSTKSKDESETQLAEARSTSSVKFSKKGSLGSIKEHTESKEHEIKEETIEEELETPKEEDEELKEEPETVTEQPEAVKEESEPAKEESVD